MANVLLPIVARYSLFFTLVLFSSSKITQSRQPTHLVQSLLLDAHLRYQERTTKKLRALIRNASTASTSSSSAAFSSALSSKDLSSLSSCSNSTTTIMQSASGMRSPGTIAQIMEEEEREAAEGGGGAGSLAQRRSDDEHMVVITTTTTATTTSSSTHINNVVSAGAADVVEVGLDQNIGRNNNNNNQNKSNQQKQKEASDPVSCAQIIPVVVAIDSAEDNDKSVTATAASTVLDGVMPEDSSSKGKVSRSSIATLLSVTLTMILLSLLQAKKRSLRKRGLVLRGTSVRRRHSRTSKHHHSHDRQHSTSAKDRLSIYASSGHSSRSNTLLSNMEGIDVGSARLSPSLRHLNPQQSQQHRHSHFHGHNPSTSSTANPAAPSSTYSASNTAEPNPHYYHQTHSDRLSKPPRALTMLNLEQEESLRGVEDAPLPSFPQQNNESADEGMYGTGNISWGLSDSHLPSGKRSTKKDFVAAWLEHQDAFPAGPIIKDEDEISWNNVDQHSRPAQQQQQQHCHQLHQHLPTPLSSPQRQEFPIQAHHPHPQHHLRFDNNRGAHRDHLPRQTEPSSWTKGDYYNYYPNYPSHPPHHQHIQQPQQQYRRQGSPTFHSSNIVPLQQSGRRLPPSPSAQPAHVGHYPYHQQQPPPPLYDPSLPRVRIQGYLEPESGYHPDSAAYGRSKSMTLSDRSSLPPPASSPSMAPTLTSPPTSSIHCYAPPRLEDLTPAERVRQEHQMRRQWHQMQQQSLQQFRQQQQQQYRLYQDEHAAVAQSSMMTRTGPHRHHGGSLSRHHDLGAVSAGELGYYPSLHSSSSSSPSTSLSKGSRSANELAWERHCYYQQLQLQEEARAAAAQRRQQQLQEQQRQASQTQEDNRLLIVPKSELGARTSSLNRLTSSELTSLTAVQLGLSRSKSNPSREPALPPTPPTSVHGHGRSEAESSNQRIRRGKQGVPAVKPVTRAKSMTSDCKFLSMFMRKGDSKETSRMTTTTAAAVTSNTTSRLTFTDPVRAQLTEPVMTLPQAQDSTTSLSRKKTIKDLAPSIKSLARRFGSSSRPNSFAGSRSDPMDMHLASGPLSSQCSSVPRELTQGPDGIVDLQQAAAGSMLVAAKSPSLTSISTPSLTLETTKYTNPGTTRKVTLFRSKTMTLSQSRKADEVLQTLAEDDSNTTTGRRHDSLRLANGRGLDLTLFSKDSKSKNASSSATQDSIAKSASTLEGVLPSSGLYINNNNTNSNSNHIINQNGSANEDAENLEEVRRQVLSLLAQGRKDRTPSKTSAAAALSATAPPMPMATNKISSATPTRLSALPIKVSPSNRLVTTTTFISPLALEALEPPPPPVPEKDDAKTGLEWKEDPCERISFMLVPKSRYEFQPLFAEVVGE